MTRFRRQWEKVGSNNAEKHKWFQRYSKVQTFQHGLGKPSRKVCQELSNWIAAACFGRQLRYQTIIHQASHPWEWSFAPMPQCLQPHLSRTWNTKKWNTFHRISMNAWAPIMWMFVTWPGHCHGPELSLSSFAFWQTTPVTINRTDLT